MSPVSVNTILNEPVDSNCYVITMHGSREVVLVDPAVGKGSMLMQYLDARSLQPAYIILTHEHFDHVSSVELIREKYGCPVIASEPCSIAIMDPKKNLSLFRDQVGFSCRPADIIINMSGEFLTWNNANITFYLTPGHSIGGLCFCIGDYLFTGDTWMEGLESPTKLPGGSKQQLAKSMKLLNSLGDTHTIVYPGHGVPFQPFVAVSNTVSI